MLRHWVPVEKLDLYTLLIQNSNPMAISFLENGWYIKENDESGDKSDGDGNRKNMSIDSMIKGFTHNDWNYLSSFNPNAISLLETNIDKINWFRLSSNPNAISLLETNIHKINWIRLSSNPNAMALLQQNLGKIDWNNLSRNPNAISLLETNLDKINWQQLSSNPSRI